MNNRTSTDPIDGNTVDQIRLGSSQVSAHGPCEEAQRVGLNRRVPEPTHVQSDSKRITNWEERYRGLWEWKVAFEKEHNG